MAVWEADILNCKLTVGGSCAPWIVHSGWQEPWERLNSRSDDVIPPKKPLYEISIQPFRPHLLHTYARCKLCLWWRKLCPLLPWRQSQNTNLKCVFLTPLSGAAVPDDTSSIFQLNELPRARSPTRTFQKWVLCKTSLWPSTHWKKTISTVFFPNVIQYWSNASKLYFPRTLDVVAATNLHCLL